jgi:predicted metal-binding membrane protein
MAGPMPTRWGAALRRPTAPQAWVLAAVAICWALAAGLVAAGRSDLVSHDAIIESGRLPLVVAIPAFLLVWQLMTGAMMLPSALPAIGVYGRLARAQARPRVAIGVFLAAYFVVWTGFAAASLAGDTGLHWMVDRWAWLGAHEELISGGLLVGAGLFQLTPLKERCLTACRNPLQLIWPRYQPGLGGAWRLGVAHARYCLGCCWALMLVMFGVGVGSVTLMAALSGIMVVEKTWRGGARVVPLVSAALVGLGIATMALPALVAAVPRLP